MLAAAVGLLATGCTGGSTGPAAPPSAPDRSLPAGAPAVPPSATAVTASPEPVESAPVVLLQGDGLGMLQSDGSVVALPFGTPVVDVVADVEDALGPVTPTELPCRQGPRTGLVVAGFTLLLDTGAFAGWSDTGAPDRALTTVDGLGVGSVLDELQSALPDVQVGADALGPTWTSTTGLSGRLAALDPTAPVTAVAGGQTCLPP